MAGYFFLKKIISFKNFFFSKKRSADFIFILHFVLFNLPVLALPDPEVDPTLGEVRSRFVQEIGAHVFVESQEYSLEVRSDILSVYGLLKSEASRYKPNTPTRTSTLILRTPEAGYLERQGIWWIQG